MRHLTDQAMEDYAAGQLAEDQLAPHEEHLLICEHCQDRQAEWDSYVRAMVAAVREYRKGRARQAGQ